LSVAERWVDAPVTCGDPECPESQPSAQPEADGDLRYYACLCGYEFGFEKAAPAEGNCSLGVPEEVRRAVSIEPGSSAPPQGPQPVFLGTTIGRRPQ
jgi:hypothetical protein